MKNRKSFDFSFDLDFKSNNLIDLTLTFKGPWTLKLTYHFLKRAQFSENFDSNIGTQRFVNTKKLTFEIDDLRKWRKKRDAMLTG